MAVLVNDFGPLNIDAQLIVGVEEDAVSLANGCICCSIRDDLLRAVLAVAARPDPPEHILIEASGVSDPGAVAQTFTLPEMRATVRLDGVITVVDAEGTAAQEAYSNLLFDQVAGAGVILLNKVDLVDEARRETVRAWIRGIAPRARILDTVQADAPLELLLGAGAHGPAPADTRDHRAEFATWSFESDRPFARQAVTDACKRLPVTIFRAKGILWVADAPERRVILQMAGRHTRLTYGEPWGDAPPRTQLALIGTPGGVDAAALQATFEACLA
jgi:G3E family GTPase